MASFTTGRGALLGVADAMELLPTIGRRPDNQQYIEIRVGVHCGKATVVPLNGVNDYFGQTTNIAARVQSVAKGESYFT
jgi:class 3 adenylate cyclase